MDETANKLKQYIDETVSFGEIQAEILLNFMENNKKAIDKHQNRSALLTIDEMNREKAEQYHTDVQIIRDLKKKLPKKLFHFIAVALHESKNWTKIEIVDTTTGKYQQENKHFGMWVDQYCEYEDSYSGYCYVLLTDGKYIKWEYWM